MSKKTRKNNNLLSYPLIVCRVRGRNTENIDMESNILNGSSQHKHRIIHEFIHYQRYISFSRNDNNFNKMSTHGEIKVILGIMRYG